MRAGTVARPLYENEITQSAELSGWAATSRNFLIPTLDFAVIHLWADLWLKCDEDCKLAFADSWITGRLAEARQTFDKPVLLEEFGKWKPYESRDVFFRRAYEASTAPHSENSISCRRGDVLDHAPGQLPIQR